MIMVYSRCQVREAIGAWRVVLYSTQKMKQTVMKSSTQVWLGKRLVAPQHHSKKGESKQKWYTHSCVLLALECQAQAQQYQVKAAAIVKIITTIISSPERGRNQVKKC